MKKGCGVLLLVVLVVLVLSVLPTMGQETGRLALDVSPEPADVFIDGKKYAEGSGVFKLPTGDHIVEIKKEGFPTQKLKVFIGPDAVITKTVAFVPPTPTPAPTPPAIETRTDALTGMEFVKIPAGCFQMGCGPQDGNCGTGEKPAHKVCVDEFWLGKYKVTQAQWQKIMGSDPAYNQDSPVHPVEQVSWDDVQAYLKKLNWQAGTFAYRLPTEAEWEYACRAGTQTAYSFGNDHSKLGEYVWYGLEGKTHAVGQLKPNPWGLYDMPGNLYEWCQDWYDANYYANSPEKNPQGASDGSYRVVRGTWWGGTEHGARSAFRPIPCVPAVGHYDIGFRLVRTK
jgi:formylglycine-generating enzyme required for sulfatase activity